MVKFQMCPSLFRALTNELIRWRYGLPEIKINHVDDSVKTCISDKQRITIPTSLKGFIPKSLIMSQEKNSY